jgi:hypothetical protein
VYWVPNFFIYDASEIGALEALPHAPLYAASIVCLGVSSLSSPHLPPTHFWLLGIYTLLFVHKHFLAALAHIVVDTLTQLAALARLPVISKLATR